MKSFLATCFIVVLFTNCTSSQTKKQEITMYNPHPEINSSNLVDSVMSHIRSYPKEPTYYIFAENINCYYEILINDLPVESLFKKSIIGSPIYINMGITRSGEQKLTYRLYPYGETFDGRANFDFNMKVIDRPEDFASSRELLEHKAPSHIEMRGSKGDQMSIEVFDGYGKTYYEHTVSFQAQVPYQVEGWTTGQDLRKLDQDTLYGAVMDYYKNYKKIYENEDEDLLAGLIYESVIQTSQEKYKVREDIEAVWDEHKQMLKADEKDYFSMADSPMKFYGDGRVVALHLVSDQVRFTDWSALSFKYKLGNRLMVRSIGICLYLPKGEKDLQKFKLAF